MRRIAARLQAGDGESGMTTAEYAVGTVAACGFGGLLFKLLTSPQVFDMLEGLIGKALRIIL